MQTKYKSDDKESLFEAQPEVRECFDEKYIMSLHEDISRINHTVVKLISVVVALILFIIYLQLNPMLSNENQKYLRSRPILENTNYQVDMEDIIDEFSAFSKKHEKKYVDEKTSMERLKAYHTTAENLLAWADSSEHGDVTYGHNEMSDWTDEEFEKTLLPKSFYKRLHKDAEYITPVPEHLTKKNGEQASGFPDFFDWRDKGVITPVKAQGKCGSCWAFASTATVEAAYAIAHGEKRNLSEQTLLDCDLVDNACDGGDEDKAFRFIHRNGLANSVDLPYVAHRQNTCAVTDHWNTTKIKAAYFLHHDEDSMINWLVNFGPVNIGMAVIQPMRAYKGGVFTPSEYACKNEVIGLHALLVTGYGTSESGEKYWIVKNSWGDTWGVENGYIYFARGINACGIEDEPIGILA